MNHIKKFNESISENNITVYVVLYWFWEGDSYLINTYEDCFLNKEEALKYAEKESLKGNTKLKIYKDGEDIPEESDGHYGSDGFIEIIEKQF